MQLCIFNRKKYYRLMSLGNISIDIYTNSYIGFTILSTSNCFTQFKSKHHKSLLYKENLKHKTEIKFLYPFFLSHKSLALRPDSLESL
jgi:hypothetical protein